MKKQLVTFFWIGALVLWMGMIFYLSSIPGLSSGLSWDYLLRKLAHMSVFGVLFLLALKNAMNLAPQHSLKTLYVVSAIFTLLYAASDEFHQAYIANRHGTPVDVLIDGVGVLLAGGVATQLPRIVTYFSKGKK